MSVAALILAAGRSTRMGTNKLVAELAGKPLIRRTAEVVLASRARPVIVITGHEAEKLAPVLAGLDIIRIDNPRHGEGLSTSLLAGIAALPDHADAALICLGDMALIRPATLDYVIENFEQEPELGAIVPTFRGEWGNPVLLARKLFAPVTRLGGDAGARKLLHGRTDVRVFDVDDPAILVDADTPSALAEMRRRVEKNPRCDEMSSPTGRSRHSRPSGPKGREGKQARHSRPSDPKDREGKGNHTPPRRL